MEHTLRFGVFFDECYAGGCTGRGFEIAQSFHIDRKEAAGRAIFRRHVGNSGTVGQRQARESGPIKLDQLADNTFFAQQLCHCQHKIGGCAAFQHLALQAEADDLGQQHRLRLAEHCRFRLDASDAPAEHRQAIHHRGMRISADQRVGIGHFNGLFPAFGGRVTFLSCPHCLRQIFEIDLMADARAGRHDAEIVESFLAPLQKSIALAIALILEVNIGLQRFRAAKLINNDRMIDDEVNRHQRVDFFGVAAKLEHGVAHGGQIDDCRHTSKILHQHAGRAEGDLAVGLALVFEPDCNGSNVFLGDGAAILEAQQVFQQNFHRHRKLRNAIKPILLGRFQRKIAVSLRAHL